MDSAIVGIPESLLEGKEYCEAAWIPFLPFVKNVQLHMCLQIVLAACFLLLIQLGFEFDLRDDLVHEER